MGWERFGKVLLVNAVRCCIYKFKFQSRLKIQDSTMQSEEPYINNIQKCSWFLWAWAHLRWTDAKWERGLLSGKSSFQIVTIADV